MSDNNNFSRSNVNERTLAISQPDKSTFDLGHNDTFTPQLGRFHPVNFEKIMPNSTISGSVTPKLSLEKCAGASVGKIRLDTHTFFVAQRRFDRSFRSTLQKLSHTQTSSAPHFNPLCLVIDYFASVCNGGFRHFSPVEARDLFLSDVLGIDSGLDPLDSTILDPYITGLRAIVADTSWRYGYTQDWFSLELNRVLDLRNRISDGAYTNFFDIFVDLIEPLCGAGSIFDVFGYPIVTPYSPFANAERGSATSTPQREMKYILGIDDEDGSFYNCNNVECDFSPIFAAYCCYYDYIRDYHVEPSGSQGLLDPDTFVESYGQNVIGKLQASQEYKLYVGALIQLLVPKFRFWSRDGLTTIQPDDVYRHVYSPVASLDRGSVSTADARTVANAVDILIENERIPFLGDKLFIKSGSAIQTLKQDLQTMRRAGMLEKWLARSYYHPDTFSGYVEAHYGCSPQDGGILSALYLGGDESYISGDQQLANVSTDETPAGTRTFVGGGSVSDSFSLYTTEFGYVISFVSLVPIRKYDAANMHLQELSSIDLPSPEFATDARCTIAGGDLIRNMSRNVVAGYVPRYYQYRTRLDAAHGKYLTDYRYMDFLGDVYQMHDPNQWRTEERSFTLSPYFLRCHPNMDGFVGLKEWDTVAFGDVDIKLNVQCPLPAAIEFI